MPEEEYLQQFPDGRWMDTRYKYGRGTRSGSLTAPIEGAW